MEGLIKRGWLEAAFDRHDKLKDEEDTRGFEPFTLRLDVAYLGADANALTILRGSVVEEIRTWRGLTLTLTAEKVVEIGKELRDRLYHPRHNPTPPLPKVYVDAPGLGIGCHELILGLGYPSKDYWGSHSPLGYAAKEKFLNRRSESFWYLRECLEQGRIAIPRNEQLASEVMAVEWFLNSAGRIQITAKKDLKGTLGHSPDMTDSLVIGLSCAHGVGQPSTMIGTINVYHGGFTTSNWRRF